MSRTSAPPTVPSVHPVASPLRDRLLAVADLLGVHPSGAAMARLLRTPAPVLRDVVQGTVDDLAAAEHLALLAAFAAQVRAHLDDGDADHLAQRLVAWRRWLVGPSLPSPDGGTLRPIDRLAEPDAVLDAICDLAGPPIRRAGLSMRLVTLLRPAR